MSCTEKVEPVESITTTQTTSETTEKATTTAVTTEGEDTTTAQSTTEVCVIRESIDDFALKPLDDTAALFEDLDTNLQATSFDVFVLEDINERIMSVELPDDLEDGISVVLAFKESDSSEYQLLLDSTSQDPIRLQKGDLLSDNLPSGKVTDLVLLVENSDDPTAVKELLEEGAVIEACVESITTTQTTSETTEKATTTAVCVTANIRESIDDFALKPLDDTAALFEDLDTSLQATSFDVFVLEDINERIMSVELPDDLEDGISVVLAFKESDSSEYQLVLDSTSQEPIRLQNGDLLSDNLPSGKVTDLVLLVENSDDPTAVKELLEEGAVIEACVESITTTQTTSETTEKATTTAVTTEGEDTTTAQSTTEVCVIRESIDDFALKPLDDTAALFEDLDTNLQATSFDVFVLEDINERIMSVELPDDLEDGISVVLAFKESDSSEYQLLVDSTSQEPIRLQKGDLLSDNLPSGKVTDLVLLVENSDDPTAVKELLEEGAVIEACVELITTTQTTSETTEKATTTAVTTEGEDTTTAQSTTEVCVIRESIDDFALKPLDDTAALFEDLDTNLQATSFDVFVLEDINERIMSVELPDDLEDGISVVLAFKESDSSEYQLVLDSTSQEPIRLQNGDLLSDNLPSGKVTDLVLLVENSDDPTAVKELLEEGAVIEACVELITTTQTTSETTEKATTTAEVTTEGKDTTTVPSTTEVTTEGEDTTTAQSTTEVCVIRESIDDFALKPLDDTAALFEDLDTNLQATSFDVFVLEDINERIMSVELPDDLEDGISVVLAFKESDSSEYQLVLDSTSREPISLQKGDLLSDNLPSGKVTDLVLLVENSDDPTAVKELLEEGAVIEACVESITTTQTTSETTEKATTTAVCVTANIRESIDDFALKPLDDTAALFEDLDTSLQATSFDVFVLEDINERIMSVELPDDLEDGISVVLAFKESDSSEYQLVLDSTSQEPIRLQNGDLLSDNLPSGKVTDLVLLVENSDDPTAVKELLEEGAVIEACVESITTTQTTSETTEKATTTAVTTEGEDTTTAQSTTEVCVIRESIDDFALKPLDDTAALFEDLDTNLQATSFDVFVLEDINERIMSVELPDDLEDGISVVLAFKESDSSEYQLLVDSTSQEPIRLQKGDLLSDNLPSGKVTDLVLLVENSDDPTAVKELLEEGAVIEACVASITTTQTTSETTEKATTTAVTTEGEDTTTAQSTTEVCVIRESIDDFALKPLDDTAALFEDLDTNLQATSFDVFVLEDINERIMSVELPDDLEDGISVVLAFKESDSSEYQLVLDSTSQEPIRLQNGDLLSDNLPSGKVTDLVLLVENSDDPTAVKELLEEGAVIEACVELITTTQTTSETTEKATTTAVTTEGEDTTTAQSTTEVELITTTQTTSETTEKATTTAVCVTANIRESIDDFALKPLDDTAALFEDLDTSLQATSFDVFVLEDINERIMSVELPDDLEDGISVVLAFKESDSSEYQLVLDSTSQEPIRLQNGDLLSDNLPSGKVTDLVLLVENSDDPTAVKELLEEGAVIEACVKTITTTQTTSETTEKATTSAAVTTEGQTTTVRSTTEEEEETTTPASTTEICVKVNIKESIGDFVLTPLEDTSELFEDLDTSLEPNSFDVFVLEDISEVIMSVTLPDDLGDGISVVLAFKESDSSEYQLVLDSTSQEPIRLQNGDLLSDNLPSGKVTDLVLLVENSDDPTAVKELLEEGAVIEACVKTITTTQTTSETTEKATTSAEEEETTTPASTTEICIKVNIKESIGDFVLTPLEDTSELFEDLDTSLEPNSFDVFVLEDISEVIMSVTLPDDLGDGISVVLAFKESDSSEYQLVLDSTSQEPIRLQNGDLLSDNLPSGKVTDLVLLVENSDDPTAVKELLEEGAVIEACVKTITTTQTTSETTEKATTSAGKFLKLFVAQD
ncbi:uncharacterized protein [Apostichopus japonicus]|uniref:uncharacterized protein n=2 Tax=Stichopus japonicus TaxID=307972 RepID=UPI003AB23BE6